MTFEQFKAQVQEIAKRRNWTLDLVYDDQSISAWFSEPHPNDRPGRPFGEDTAQAFMKAGHEPIGLDDL